MLDFRPGNKQYHGPHLLSDLDWMDGGNGGFSVDFCNVISNFLPSLLLTDLLHEPEVLHSQGDLPAPGELVGEQGLGHTTHHQILGRLQPPRLALLGQTQPVPPAQLTHTWSEMSHFKDLKYDFKFELRLD